MRKQGYEEFRSRFSDWLSRNIPDWWRPGVSALYKRVFEELLDRLREWQARLYDEGWLGHGVPQQYGGLGGSMMQELIVREELARRLAPPPINIIGLSTVCPILLAAGTEEQRRRFIRPILRAEEIWCQGFSEPAAGSDLASLITTAEVREGSFVVRGQKIWSSLAHIADYCLLLCRTGRPEDRYKNLTLLIVDMRSEGISVSPITQITGDAEFNQIFLNDVRVPLGNVIGEVNDGWRIAMTTLNFERLMMSAEIIAKGSAALEKLLAIAREVNEPGLESKLGRLWARHEAVKKTLERMLLLADTGQVGPESALIKIAASEVLQEIYSTARDVLGGKALFGELLAWHLGFFWSIGRGIAGGTTEILKNVLAERILRLPS